MKKLLVIALCFIAVSAFAAGPETHALTINGKNFGTAVVIQGGIWAVSIEDFSRAGGAGVTLEPHFKLQGNHLFAVMGDGSVLKYKEASSLPALSVQSAQKIKYAAGQTFRVQKSGEISGHVLTFQGKRYVPIADLAHAFGGTFTAPTGLKQGEALSLNFAVTPNSIIAILIGL